MNVVVTMPAYTTASSAFSIVIQDICAATYLTVDPSILSSLDIIYQVGYPTHSETLSNTLNDKVFSYPDITGHGCPAIAFEIVDTATYLFPDTSVFTYSSL